MVGYTLGGIGLFLLGMILMTDGLKALAGDALRRVLERFAGGPVSALFTGAGVTALVQSSSATTLATIGFVSAGLLSFPQAVGVVLGANVGTTSTSWLVSLLGLKLSVSKITLPLVGIGALAKLLGRGKLSAFGMALAGFGLVFLGIDTLQAGMKELAATFDPSSFPRATVAGRLLLVGVGALMTVVMQSSSAAAATTLAALAAGTLDLTQAAALVIGQNVGTTVTAGFASIGASVPAKRTALAHVLFNAVTGLVAFAVLPLFIVIVDSLAHRLGGTDDATSLAAFHTAFNVLGVAMFLPFIGKFATAVERLVPDRGATLTRNLDRSVASLPSIALVTVRRTLLEVAGAACGAARAVLDGREAEALTTLDDVERALVEVRRFLAEVRTDQETDDGHGLHLAALHAIDHLDRLASVCREAASAKVTRDDEGMAALRGELTGGLARSLAALAGPDGAVVAEEMEQTSRNLADMRRRDRPKVLARTAAGTLDQEAALRRLEAMRWIDRLGYHAWRALHHLSTAPPETEGPRSEAFPGIDDPR